MGRYGFILRRLLGLIPLLLGVLLLVFILQHIAPGDPARLILGARASEEQVQELRDELGLNDPIFEQYVRYVGRVLQGDLGRSLRTKQPVTEIIKEKLPPTLWLLVAGTLFSLTISVPLAILVAAKPDGWLDHLTRTASLFGLTMPPFWVGIMLLLFIALPTGWFPIAGFGDTFAERVRAIILPALTMAIALSAVQIRSLRTAMIEVNASDFVTTARSLGIRGRRLAARYILPNAVLPMITLLAVQIGYMLFGAVVIEATFSLPGLGQAMVSAVTTRDFPLVQGITLVFALMVVGVHLGADVAFTIIDPRVEIR